MSTVYTNRVEISAKHIHISSKRNKNFKRVREKKGGPFEDGVCI